MGKDYVRDVTSYENLELVGVDNENIVIATMMVTRMTRTRLEGQRRFADQQHHGDGVATQWPGMQLQCSSSAPCEGIVHIRG